MLGIFIKKAVNFTHFCVQKTTDNQSLKSIITVYSQHSLNKSTIISQYFVERVFGPSVSTCLTYSFVNFHFV